MEMPDCMSQHWCYRASSDELKHIRSALLNYLLQHRVNKADAKDIVLAVNEASMNIMQHANDGNYSGDIRIMLTLENNWLTIVIEDDAKTTNISFPNEPANNLEPGGLGLYLIRDIMDSASFAHHHSGTGNVLTLKKNLEAGQ